MPILFQLVKGFLCGSTSKSVIFERPLQQFCTTVQTVIQRPLAPFLKRIRLLLIVSGVSIFYFDLFPTSKIVRSSESIICGVQLVKNIAYSAMVVAIAI